MSDEENRFVRSQGGHDANELHNHGGQDDARDNKTERENLEDEIEALVDDEPTVETVDIVEDDIEVPADEEIEEPKVEEEPAEEPITDWKAKSENKEYIPEEKTPTMTVVEEKKCGRGWKFATVFFALLAVAGCGAAAYLFFVNGTTKFLGREVTSKQTTSKTSSSANKPSETPVATTQFDFDAKTIDYAGYNNLFDDNESAAPVKIDVTKDGKYYYIIADISESGAIGGYAGVWYRETVKGASWVKLQAGNSLGECSYYNDDQRSFMDTYSYIDDDLDSQYIGCDK